MYRELTSQLKRVRTEVVNPRAEWVSANRQTLLTQIKNTVPEEVGIPFAEKVWNALSIFLPRTVVFSVVRPVAAVLVLVVTITTAYTGTVKASYEALPGDTLYPAKRFMENIPVTVASLVGDSNTETKLRVENAKNRAVEANKLIKTNDPAKISKVAAAVGDLNSELSTINAKLDATQSNQGTVIAAGVIKDVKQNTDEIKSVLQDVKTSLLVSVGTTTDKTALTQQVSDTKDLVKDVSVKAVEVIVTKHLEGDTSVSKDEVKQMISSTLQDVVSDASQSKQTVDGVKVLVDTAKVEAKDLSVEAKKQNDPSLASSTKEFSDQITSVANIAQQAAVQSQAVTQVVDQKAAEAKTLLSNDDLAKAVDAIKAVNQATKEAEKISDATVQSTQNVLPVAQVIQDSVDPVSTNTIPVLPTSSLGTLLNALSSSTTPPTTSVISLTASSTSSTVKK